MTFITLPDNPLTRDNKSILIFKFISKKFN